MEVTAGCETQLEKIKAITIFVADRIYYDYLATEEPGSTVPYDVYKERKATSSGYSNLVQALCYAVDIPCMGISACGN